MDVNGFAIMMLEYYSNLALTDNIDLTAIAETALSVTDQTILEPIVLLTQPGGELYVIVTPMKLELPMELTAHLAD